MRINDKIRKEAVKLAKFFGTILIAGGMATEMIYSGCN